MISHGEGDKMVYLDNAATTRVHPDVATAMWPFFIEYFGNPSSVHQRGRMTKKAIEQARATIANFLGAASAEVVFTSGGTEAIHTALFGAWLARPEGKQHIVTSAMEHHAVLDTISFLARQGAQVTVLKPDCDGKIRVRNVLEALRDDTLCVALMAVNNELGSAQPIVDIAAQVKDANASIIVMTDMIQSLGTQRIFLSDTAIDLASFSAHKIHGPKGIGALYIRKETRWKPALHGGAQERGRRAGTENVAGIVGFGTAVAKLSEHWTERLEHLQKLSETFRAAVSKIEGVRFHSPMDAVPTIVNLGFSGVRSDTLLMRLDLEGIFASAGSACTAGSLEPSHVLRACGYADDEVLEAIRFSFSDDTTLEDIFTAVEVLKRVVPQLRKL